MSCRWSTSSTSLDSLLSEAVAEYSQNVRSAPCDNLSSSKTSNAVELAVTQSRRSTVPSNHPPCAADSHETSTSFAGLVLYSGDISLPVRLRNLPSTQVWRSRLSQEVLPTMKMTCLYAASSSAATVVGFGQRVSIVATSHASAASCRRCKSDPGQHPS
jgi:hypothetical protein